MRILILVTLALIFPTSGVSAGSYTVTTTTEQDAQMATLKTTPQQIVSKHLDSAKKQDEYRKLSQLRRDCANKKAEACEKIHTATKGVK